MSASAPTIAVVKASTIFKLFLLHLFVVCVVTPLKLVRSKCLRREHQLGLLAVAALRAACDSHAETCATYAGTVCLGFSSSAPHLLHAIMAWLPASSRLLMAAIDTTHA